jgi:hypothetical protein
MHSDRAGLAVAVLESARIEAPVNAWLLARRNDYHLRAMRGPTPAAIGGGRVILFDVTAYWRDQHGEVARGLARAILTERGEPATPRASLLLAKELLLPRAVFERDVLQRGYDIEEIGALHRYAPIEWIDERVRELKSTARSCRPGLSFSRA